MRACVTCSDVVLQSSPLHDLSGVFGAGGGGEGMRGWVLGRSVLYGK
jgi:hypothetical protein